MGCLFCAPSVCSLALSFFSLFGIFFSGEDEEEPCGFNAYGAFATPLPPTSTIPQPNCDMGEISRLDGRQGGGGGARWLRGAVL